MRVSDDRHIYCKECEQIEARRRYLVATAAKKCITVEEMCELDKINELYMKRINKNFMTNGLRGDKSMNQIVDTLLNEIDPAK